MDGKRPQFYAVIPAKAGISGMDALRERTVRGGWPSFTAA